jgi:predicted transcriptional regulator
MSRTEAIAKITASLPQLSDERVQALAELAASWTDDADAPAEDEATRAAIANGIAQARRGEFATDEEVTEAFKRFRK